MPLARQKSVQITCFREIGNLLTRRWRTGHSHSFSRTVCNLVLGIPLCFGVTAFCQLGSFDGCYDRKTLYCCGGSAPSKATRQAYTESRFIFISEYALGSMQIRFPRDSYL
jgi:hypothetical protein